MDKSSKDRAFRNTSRRNESTASSKRPSSSNPIFSATFSRASSSSSNTSLHPSFAARSSGSVMVSRRRGFLAFGSIACRVRARGSGAPSGKLTILGKTMAPSGGCQHFSRADIFLPHSRQHARTRIRVQRGVRVHRRARAHADTTRRAVPTILYARSRPRDLAVESASGVEKEKKARPSGLIRRSS